jgi:GNAT superfamily N-acetyltransferase
MMQTAHVTAVNIGLVTVDRIIDLRHRILRAGLPVATATFEGDDGPHTTHYAAFLIDAEGGQPTGRPIGCASFMLKDLDWTPAWQLRGMATDRAFQGRGVGRQLLETAIRELGSHPQYDHVELMWCNAREPAVKFYEKYGWRCVSDVFDIPTAGPHIKMVKYI